MTPPDSIPVSETQRSIGSVSNQESKTVRFIALLTALSKEREGVAYGGYVYKIYVERM